MGSVAPARAEVAAQTSVPGSRGAGLEFAFVPPAPPGASLHPLAAAMEAPISLAAPPAGLARREVDPGTQQGQGDPGLLAGGSWGRRGPERDPSETEVRSCLILGAPAFGFLSAPLSPSAAALQAASSQHEAGELG